MNKLLVLLFLVGINGSPLFAQSKNNADSVLLITLNQQIDTKVISQDTVGLSLLYADDFVFSHGSGRVDNKQSWLRSVAKGGFILRQHDSVTVELHPFMAIVKGRLSVEKKNKEKIDRYFLKYIRVYAIRNEQWQLVSHSTVYEKHE